MAEEENTGTSTETGQSTKSGSSARTAVKAAAAAAATGAAAVAVKKALDSRSNGSENGNGSGGRKSGNTQSLVMSVAAGSWDAAQDAIVPLAGDAAAAAGKFLAQSGPDVVKEEIVPKFIDAFNEAR